MSDENAKEEKLEGQKSPEALSAQVKSEGTVSGGPEVDKLLS